MRQRAVCTVFFLLLFLWAFTSVGISIGQEAKALNAKANNATSQESIQTRTQIPYRDSSIQIVSDKAERSGEMFHFAGKVQIAVEDITVTCDSAEYNSTAYILKTSGQVKISHDQIRMAASECVIYLDQLKSKR